MDCIQQSEGKFSCGSSAGTVSVQLDKQRGNEVT